MNRRRNWSVRPRVVFDYNTLIQAIAFHGPAAQCLAEVEADYLVTREKDLLSLMTGHLTICRQLRRRAPSLRIIAPGVFLDALVQPRQK